jgi:predicted HD phosphohydrolase
MSNHTTFKSFQESTIEDWKRIGSEFLTYAQGLADRVIEHLQKLEGDYGGFPIDRYAHSLQTATRALRDGRDEEYVVCALLHDIGDTLGAFNHPDIAAAILKPFVSEANHWMIAHHGIFQGHYFFHHIGLDRDLRDQFASHPHYAYTAQFCELYDSPAFDRDYDTLPFEVFEPMLRRVMRQPLRGLYAGKMPVGATDQAFDCHAPAHGE